MRYTMLAVFLSLWLCVSSSGQIIYVDADSNDANDGSSWSDAYNYVHEALANASYGDEIRVAQGIYKPWPPISSPPPPPPPPGSSQSNEKDDIIISSNDRKGTFLLTNGVVIKGGYAGFGEPDPNARDIEMYETILSGDLNGDDGPDFNNNTENTYHVVIGNWTDANTILDGFTIRGGNANDYYSPGDRGGGIYNFGSRMMLTNCTISGNVASGDGGGMYNSSSQPTVVNCTFSGNLAYVGSGMCNESSSPNLTNCIFNGNSADYGGGIRNYSGQPTATNCTFSGNSAYRGGGMYNDVTWLILTNCTLSGNVARGDGGGMYNKYDDTTLTNCILWGNIDSGGTDESAQIYGETPLVRYSCIQDDNPNDTYIPFEGDYNHNIDDDPMFVREPNDGGDGWGVGDNDDFGDLHLRPSSPCINTGNPYFLVDSDSVDMDYQPRIFDGRVDIGADEFVVPTVIVIRPKGGEVWATGSNHEINWFSYGVSETVNIRLSTDGGNSWPFIESSIPNSGNYKLQLPDTNESNQSLISVVPSIPDPNAICIESGLFTIQSYSSDPAVESKWKSLGGNFKRTGLSDSNGPEVGCVKWQFDANGTVSASVTVGFDGRVHIGCEDGNVYTLDANGVLLWSYDANSPLLSSPTIGPDGTIYVGSESGILYAVDVNGSLRWTHLTNGPIYSSPAVSADGNNIYVCSQDGILYALETNGSELWNFEMDGPAELPSSTFASPTIGTDGTIYIAGLYDPNLYALEANDGIVKWSCSFEFPVEPGNPNSEMKSGLPFASPVVASDGTIYQTLLYDSNLCAIEPNAGTIIWSIDLADATSGWFDANYAEDFGNAAGWSEPALGPDGTIYVSFDDPYLRAVDPNGNIKWVVPIGNTGGFTLAVGNDGLIYAAGDDANLYVVDSNGSRLAEFQTDYWLSFPVIAANDTLIVSGINDEAGLTGDANSTIWLIRGHGCEDLNLDEFINFVDYTLLAADWLDCTDPGYPCNYGGSQLYFIGDIDQNKYVYFSDLAALAGKWLEEIKWLKPSSAPPAPPPPPPIQASNPNPANGATGVSTTADLNWTAGSRATSHDIYFGTSNPPSFAGNQTATTFDPGTMAYATTYYWQIDEVGLGGTTTGVVWSFTTSGGPPPPPPPP